MKKTLINIYYIINYILIAWIVISTLQGMFHTTISEWNCWKLFVDVMKWRMALWLHRAFLFHFIFHFRIRMRAWAPEILYHRTGQKSIGKLHKFFIYFLYPEMLDKCGRMCYTIIRKKERGNRKWQEKKSELLKKWQKCFRRKCMKKSLKCLMRENKKSLIKNKKILDKQIKVWYN